MKEKALAMLLGLSAYAASTAAQTAGNLLDSHGQPVRNGSGELCWRTYSWTPVIAERGCDGGFAVAAPKPTAPPPVPTAPPPVPVPTPTPAPATKGVVYPVWYGTNRKPSAGKALYSAERASTVEYGKIFVEFPDEYFELLAKDGWISRYFKSAETVLRLRPPIPMKREALISNMRDELRKLSREDKVALIFLHGFNTTFVEAAQRTASIGYQLKMPVTAFFSWPSAAGDESARYYFTDFDLISLSEKLIAQFIADVVRGSGAQRVHLIAHSMGNEALLSLVDGPLKAAARKYKFRLGQIILAAPDVDKEALEEKAKAYTEIAEGVTLYASTGDVALNFAKGFRPTRHRAGLLPPAVRAKGIEVIDVGAVNLGALGHAYVADELPVLHDMLELVTRGTLVGQRCRTSRHKDGHWVLAKPSVWTDYGNCAKRTR